MRGTTTTLIKKERSSIKQQTVRECMCVWVYGCVYDAMKSLMPRHYTYELQTTSLQPDSGLHTHIIMYTCTHAHTRVEQNALAPGF